MVKISRNTSVYELIAELQQIEVIRYHRAQNQQLSNSLDPLSVQRAEHQLNRTSTELYSDEIRIDVNERYSANRYVTESSLYFDDQTQSVEMSSCQETDPYDKENQSHICISSSDK